MKDPIKIILLRIVNFYRGSSVKPFGSILRKFYQKHLQKKMPENRWVLAKIDGIRYKLDLNQYSELETYYGGGYEPTVIKIIKKYVKPGMTVMDVGARIGLHTLRLKKLAGEKGKVFAIDPDKETFFRLLENAKLNNYSIIAENKALSDKNSGEEITLDSFIGANRVGQLDFIKIDTDGWEYKVIQGGAETLRKFKPVMVVEFNRELVGGGSLQLMIGLLGSLGYSFFQGSNLKEYPDKKSIINEVSLKGNVNILCK
ncbi:MAG: FkbM family methyltransferase [bacterium]